MAPPELKKITNRKGVVVALSRYPSQRCPEQHGWALFCIMVQNSGGREVVPSVIMEHYFAACDEAGARPFPWTMVRLAFHTHMREVYGKKDYHGWSSAREAASGRQVTVRTILIPTQHEVEAANAARQNPDQVVALHQHG